jgi:hypothetical protein
LPSGHEVAAGRD